MADWWGVQGVVDAVVQRRSRIDVPVSNAVLNVATRDVGSVSAADWVTVPDVDLTGTFLMTRSVLPSMRAQGSGTVLNVSSLRLLFVATLPQQVNMVPLTMFPAQQRDWSDEVG